MDETRAVGDSMATFLSDTTLNTGRGPLAHVFVDVSKASLPSDQLSRAPAQPQLIPVVGRTGDGPQPLPVTKNDESLPDLSMSVKHKEQEPADESEWNLTNPSRKNFDFVNEHTNIEESAVGKNNDEGC